MKNKIILTILILSVTALIFSGCIGGSVTPPIPDNTNDSEIPEPEVCNLPTYPINVKMQHIYYESYFDIELKNVGLGYDIYDGNWTGWCADKETLIESYVWYQGYVYCSYSPPNRYGIEWPKINWIINNKGSYSVEYIQDAIWHFTNGYAPNGLAMAAEAHPNFCPQSGQKYIAIIDIPGKQLTFIEVPVEQNKTEYRAFLVGVGDYVNYPNWYPYAKEATDLLSPPYDVKMVKQTLKQCRFGSLNTEFISIENVMDTWATKLAILYGIKSSFAGADANDISYFYFNGHGSRGFNTSYLCPTSVSFDVFLWMTPVDTSSCISVDELESALSAVPGTKVVLLDCCRSGGFIGKGEDEVTSDDSVDFNNDVINVFSQSSSNKGNLATNKYIVLTSCASNQISYELINVDIMDDEYILTEDPYCYFTKFLCEGCGYNQVCPYPADSNIDTQVTLNEAYTYIKDQFSTVSTLNETDVQIWPENSSFTIVEY
jgi:hypothetical protein